MGISYSVSPRTYWAQDLEAAIPSLMGQTMAITGCTSGTGREAARVVLQKGGKVLMLNRASRRAEEAEEAMRKFAADPSMVQTIECDLSDFESTREAARRVQRVVGNNGLDGLGLNAGVMALEDIATNDGYDIQMQTNHLSHFLLTKELIPLLNRAAELRGEARIVSMTSEARNIPKTPLDIRYLEKNGGSLGGDAAGVFFDGPRWERYHQSKLANCLFAFALYERLKAVNSKIKSILAHPGLSASSLQQTTHLSGGMPAWWLAMSCADGAIEFTQALCGGEKKRYGGLVGVPELITPEPMTFDPERKELLWKMSEVAVGPFLIPSNNS